MTNLALIATSTTCVKAYVGATLGTGFIVLLALLAIWTIIWKGLALWKSAGKRDKVWFVIMLVVNTVGILEILYIYVFSRPKTSAPTMPPTSL